MSGNSNLKRNIVSAFAALLMSSVAVGSAIAPAHVGANAGAANAGYILRA
jgi:hypothetical protein